MEPLLCDKHCCGRWDGEESGWTSPSSHGVCVLLGGEWQICEQKPSEYGSMASSRDGMKAGIAGGRSDDSPERKSGIRQVELGLAENCRLHPTFIFILTLLPERFPHTVILFL